MALSNVQFRYYDSNVLRLPQDKRTEYHEQVDRLVAALNKSLRGRTKIKVTRVVKAGSFAKFTILRKTTDDPVDVDLVFYVAGRSIDAETLASLCDTIHELLIEIYPNKSVEDFVIQRKAATVTFAGSGLSVDIVPVIEDPAREEAPCDADRRDAGSTGRPDVEGSVSHVTRGARVPAAPRS